MKNKLWGGRFEKETDPLVEEFTKSIHYDYKLAASDLAGSAIHVKVLGASGILTSKEVSKLSKAIDEVLDTVKNGSFKPDMSSEDIHTNIQNLVQKKVGDLGLKLHTARSRNDQVVFATKLYAKCELDGVINSAGLFITSLNNLNNSNKGLIMPGFTHMQHAQPVYLKDYLGAYISMLGRDIKRLKNANDNICLSMGAGALAGTPIDALKYNRKIARVGETLSSTSNAMDDVSERDFVIEILSALAIIGMHLSRLSEDLIIWSSKEFSFVDIDESYCTGSSLMPQKKNPDVLELIRGYTGRLYGNLFSVFTTMKGLPLAYNRDMQLDKEPLFSSFDLVSKELEVFTGLMASLKFNKDKIDCQLEDESLYATYIAHYLVGKGVPFKRAHSIVGKLINNSIKRSALISEMTQDELSKFSDKLNKKDLVKLLDPKEAIKTIKSVRR